MNSFIDKLLQLAAWIRRQLLEVGYRSADDPKRFQSFPMAVCVLAALLIWLSLSLDETYTIDLNLDTRVVNLHLDSVLVRFPSESIKATVTGTGMALFGLRYDRPLVDLEASRGTSATPVIFDIPQDVTVIQLIPDRVELHKDVRISKRVQIRLMATIEPRPRHDFFSEFIQVPDSVTISGAKSIVDEISSWPTAATSHTDVHDTLDVVVPLADTLSGLVTLDQSEIRVLSKAYQYTEAARVLTVQVTDLPTTQPPVELDPGSVEVTYRVALEHYDEVLAAGDFYATVPYAVIRNDTTGRVVPRIHLPMELLARQTDVFPRMLAYFIYLGTE